jgi:hypothetical protein
MDNSEILKFYDPSDMDAAANLGDAALDLLKALCEAIDLDQIRMPKDGLRKDVQRSILKVAEALKIDYHEDELLSVDERLYSLPIYKILGKLFCQDGRELGFAKRYDGEYA